MSEFMTTLKHVNFRAKKLFGVVGKIVDGALAYMNLDGGEPTKLSNPNFIELVHCLFNDGLGDKLA